MNNQLRIYTKRNLRPSFFEGFFRRYSLTTWLIIINVLVFVIIFSLIAILGESFSEKIFSWVALQPNAFFSGQFWQLLTSIFMHGSFTHLFVNMVSLFFIGNFIEKLIGRKRFFWLYMISGIFAGLFFIFLSYFLGNSELGARIFGSPEIFAVGASGAIFALAGLLAILTPKLRVYVFFIIPMQMWFAMVVLLGGFWLASFFGNLPIGNTAHLGGLLIGAGYAFYLRKKYPEKTRRLATYFSG
jgi:membrane associated rhomboid family serine protease